MADETAIKPFVFDYERAKETIKRVLGEYLNDDEITNAIDYYMKHNDIKNAQDIFFGLKNEFTDLPDLGSDKEKKSKIYTAINTYESTPEYDADWKKDLEYEKQFGILPHGVGGARIRRTRKSAVKRRKSSRRSSKQRKSSRRQSLVRHRRRRTNKK